MTAIRSFAALAAVAFTVLPGSALAGDRECRHSAAEYVQAIKHFEGQAAKARALALQNPLYESDVAYYTSVLADARTCLRSLAPITTASR
jgi:hypothetical protein